MRTKADDRETFEKTLADRALLRILHQTIGKITQDFSGRWHFNTSIASIMNLVNKISDHEGAMDRGEISRNTIERTFLALTLLLAPFAPFLSAELWEQMGYVNPVFRQRWPVMDEELARESEMEIPVQVNGKLVTVVTVVAGSDEEKVKAAALGDAKVMSRIAGKTVAKVIVVAGKLVSLVVK